MKWEKNEEGMRIFRSYFRPLFFVADANNSCKPTTFVFTVDPLIMDGALRSKPNAS
jgi:hypothetical protein